MLRRAFGMQAFTIQDARLGRFYLCDRVIDDVGCRVGVSSLDGTVCALTNGGEEGGGRV